MIEFLRGALAMACVVSALFFLRFWRLSRDRLFLIFALAFFVFSLNWLMLAVEAPVRETQHYYYIVRFVAFLMIALAIVDKNRRPT